MRKFFFPISGGVETSDFDFFFKFSKFYQGNLGTRRLTQLTMHAERFVSAKKEENMNQQLFPKSEFGF